MKKISLKLKSAYEVYKSVRKQGAPPGQTHRDRKHEAKKYACRNRKPSED